MDTIAYLSLSLIIITPMIITLAQHSDDSQ